jgi:phosphoglycolate phosphatase-like HAD superfamily hydrolase
MNAIENIVPVFDFDGVVMVDAGGRNGIAIFRRMGVKITEEEFFDLYRNLGKAYVSCLDFTGAKTPEEQAKWFDRVYLPTWHRFSASDAAVANASLHRGVAKALGELEALGAKPLIVSNNQFGYISRALAKHGIAGKFSGVMSNGFCAEYKSKPATDLFHAGVREYGIAYAGKTIVMVGDTASDYEFARNLAAEGLDCRFIGTYYDDATKRDDMLVLAQRIACKPADIVSHIKAIADERR